MTGGVTWAHRSMCDSCKRYVRHKGRGGRHRWHGCRIRWVARRVARAQQRGWWEGYRFALDNVSDPMVYADIVEYGTGWAGLVRAGGLVIHGDEATR